MAEYLKEFIEGETIYASEQNSNNQYLLDQISDSTVNLNTKINTLTSNVNSQLETQQQNLNAKLEEINTKISDLEENTSVTALGVSLAPDYSKGVGISLPYTVTTNGYVFVDIATGDANGRVNINGKPVLGHQSSQYGGIPTHVGGTFRVSTNDTITATVGVSTAYFYPLKGV